jgi:ketosteroid isomerase-like protein
MAPAKVEALHQAIAYSDAGDWDGLGALIAADAVASPPDGWPEPGPFRGRAQIVAQFQSLFESFGMHGTEVEGHVEAGDWIVARTRAAVEGSGSGLPAEIHVSVALRFDGERFTEAHYRWEHGDALEIAGLSPPAEG